MKMPIIFDSSEVLGVLNFGKTEFRRLKRFRCDIGDVLWVKEKITKGPMELSGIKMNAIVAKYAADNNDVVEDLGFNIPPWWDGDKDLPASKMPFKASRILLTVTNIRQERLQDVNIKADGSYLDRCECMPRKKDKTPIDSMFTMHWCHIHGQEFKNKWLKQWNDNPWVWVVEFSASVKS